MRERDPVKKGLVVAIAGLYEKSTRDPATNCLHWNGALSQGVPRIWTIDYRCGEKRTLSGPLAVYMIAHGKAPDGIPFRRCNNKDCVQPAHLLVARDRAELGRFITKLEFSKAWDKTARVRNIRAAMVSRGVQFVPDAVVLAIRGADKSVTGRAMARQYGLSESVVSSIRKGKSYTHVQPLPEAA